MLEIFLKHVSQEYYLEQLEIAITLWKLFKSDHEAKKRKCHKNVLRSSCGHKLVWYVYISHSSVYIGEMTLDFIGVKIGYQDQEINAIQK